MEAVKTRHINDGIMPLASQSLHLAQDLAPVCQATKKSASCLTDVSGSRRRGRANLNAKAELRGSSDGARTICACLVAPCTRGARRVDKM